MSHRSLKVLSYGGAVLVAALIGIRSARSQNPQVKTWTNGETLTAADLNASFAALQAATGPANAGPAAAGIQYAWSGFAPATQSNGFIQPDGHVARLTFTSAVAGFVFVTANYEVRVRNTFDTTKMSCRVEALLAQAPGMSTCPANVSCSLAGYAENTINANLPTQLDDGSYFGLTQVASTVLPLTQGENTIYLNGRSDCTGASWGAVSITALYVNQKPNATLTMP